MKIKKFLGAVVITTMLMSTTVLAEEATMSNSNDYNYNSERDAEGESVEGDDLFYINPNLRLTASTYQQVLKEYDNDEIFTFKNGTCVVDTYLYSSQCFTDVTNGTLTVKMTSDFGDGVVRYYKKRTKLLGGGAPDITRDTEVASPITCAAGKTTTINLTNFDPDEWYYVTVEGEYLVESVELTRTK